MMEMEHNNINMRFGVIAAAIYNTTPSKNRKKYKPDDFFKLKKTKKKKQTPEEMSMVLRSLTIAMGGKING